MSNKTQEPNLGPFEQTVLLAISSLGENAYGTPIRRAIEKAEEKEVAIGALYITLDRLQKKGMVNSVLGEPTAERGGRAKRFFELTGAGKAALQRSLRTIAAFVPSFSV